MRFILDNATLQRAVSTCAGGARANGRTIPILSHARIIARDGGVEVTTSDLDRQATIRLSPRALEIEGAACAPMAWLADIARNLAKDAEVAFVFSPQSVQIVSGRSRFVAQTLPCGDFPDFGLAGDVVALDLDPQALAQALECVSVAISRDQTRYYLNGVYAHWRDDALRLVATDGHRLIRRDLAATQTSPYKLSPAILPASAVKEIRRLAAEAPKGVRAKLSIGERRVEFELGAVHFLSKTIDGQFPDYERVIPQNVNHRLEVEAAPLSLAIQRALVAAKERRSGELDFADGRLIVSAIDGQGGQALDEIDAAGVEAPIEIAFNLYYLAEMARALAGEKLAFELADPASPAILRDPASETTVGVLMPVRA